MQPLDRALSSIEAILADIERLDAETAGAFRQAEDREALDTASRMERQMVRNRQQEAAE